MKTIRELREARGWSQYELAKRLGVTPGAVWNWEHGRYGPSGRLLQRMARLFGVSADEILLEQEEGEDGEGTTREG